MLRHTGRLSKSTEDQVFPCSQIRTEQSGDELRRARPSQRLLAWIVGRFFGLSPRLPARLFSQEHTLQGTLPYA